MLFVYVSLDLKTLYLERVEILLRILPNEQELKAYREYERDRKPTSLLSEEDRFMICVSIVQFLRLITKASSDFFFKFLAA